MIIVFIVFMGFYATIELGDMEGLLMFPFGAYVGYILYKSQQANSKHWRDLVEVT